MAEDKGSDLDVFEGLSKKKRSSSAVPPAPGTIRGGLAPPSSKAPLPPPKKSGALPRPTPPPSRSTPPPSSLPTPRVPSSRSGDSDAPVLSVKPSTGGLMSDAGPVSAAPGVASADLDWDDEEEATSVFDKSAADLFHDLGAARGRGPDESGRRNVSKAAALLASSGRSAQPVQRSRIPSEPMPRIPAPAPVPRDISGGRDSVPMSREAPSWAPSQAAPPPVAAPSRGGKAVVVLALFAVAVLAAASFFYLQRSSPSSVRIAVTHDGKEIPKVNIYVDGQKKCDFAPCLLELSPGERQIRAVSGNLAGKQRVVIEGGKEFSFEIALDVSSDVAPPEDTAEPDEDAPAKLELSSAMKDVEIKVSVDGTDKGTLPVTLDDLKAGKHELTFEGPDKFGKVTKTVELKAGESLTIDDIELPLQKVETVFVLETRGADVKLLKMEGDAEKGEQKLTFRGKESTETLDTEFKWKVVATLEGYEDFEKILDFSGVEDELEVKIELEKEKEAPEPAPVAKTPTPTPGPTPGPKTPDPQPPPPPAAQGDHGILNANSIPPSKVIIDGRPRGSTPVAGVKVSPGSHTVVFIHPEFGSKSRTVTVGAGQTKTAVVRFKKD